GPARHPSPTAAVRGPTSRLRPAVAARPQALRPLALRAPGAAAPPSAPGAVRHRRRPDRAAGRTAERGDDGGMAALPWAARAGDRADRQRLLRRLPADADARSVPSARAPTAAEARVAQGAAQQVARHSLAPDFLPQLRGLRPVGQPLADGLARDRLLRSG